MTTTRSGARPVVTDGGHVLGVTALGDTLEGARRSTHAPVAKFQFTGMFYRKDIGEKALKSSGRES